MTSAALDPNADDADALLEREALRLYRRYASEVVEAFGICPWAERARREGRVRERVLLDPAPRVAPVVEAVQALADDPQVEIGLLLLPRLRLERMAFERFVGEARRRYAELSPAGEVAMVLACFHPDARPDTDAPERLVPYLRRTPDPTIQLVRQSVLDRVRTGQPHGTGFVDPSHLDLGALLDRTPPVPLHERVARNNLETVNEVGVERLAAVLADIHRDRDETYAALRG